MKTRSTLASRPLVAALLATLLPLAACSGGGGSSGPTIGLSFQFSELEAEEDAGTLTIRVVLQTPAFLEEDVSVLVRDAAVGTATPGEDYAALAPQQVLFPTGSGNGTVQTVQLTLLADSLVEGAPETLRLELADPTGAGVMEPRRLDVTLLDSHEAQLRFVDSASSTVDEQPQDVPVLVELVLPDGVSLGVDVTASVADTGQGTATTGKDYAGFGTQQVQFAAASASGDTRAVTLRVLDDTKVENPESVLLRLQAPSAGAVVSAVPHEITITDDDAGSGAFLQVTWGPNGVETGLVSGALLDLGSQALGAGPNAGTLLRLTNVGDTPFGLGAPELGGDHPNDFALEIDSLSAPPPPEGDGLPELGPDRAAPFRVGADDPRLGLDLELDAAALASFEGLQAVTLHGFPLPGQGTVTLALRRLPLPLAPDAVLSVDGAPQPGGLRAALDGVTLWRGVVLERPGSRLFLALGPDGARGFVELPDTADRIVHVLTEQALRGAPPRVRVALEGQLDALGRDRVAPVCEGLALAPGTPPPPTDPAPPGGVASLTAPDCRLAIETDWQLTQRIGSVQAVTSYVTQLVAAVSDRYLVDAQVTLSVAYLGVYSDSNDPWSTPDGPGTTKQMLDEFQGAWSGAGWPVQGTLAHFLSGASLGGGIAYINVLCNQTYGFGVSAIKGDIDWSSWTGDKGSFTWDFMVVAHELGHNFGSAHTHDYCPPLDQCVTSTSGCGGAAACTEGTIMSYCHTCAGGMNNIRLEFHPVVADRLRMAVNMQCLGESTLAGGDWVQYLVRFNPLTATGTRRAELEISHGAPNHPDPLVLQLQGEATP